MKIYLKKIGPIESAELELGRFSILCGKNNTGKTYITYLLYCFLDFWNNEFEIPLGDNFIKDVSSTGIGHIDLFDIKRRANEFLEMASKEFSDSDVLSKVFAANSTRFEESSVLVSIEQEEIVFTPPPGPLNFSQGDDGTTALMSVSYVEESGKLEVSVLKDLLASEREFIHVLVRRVQYYVKRIVFFNSLPRPHISSAERTGAAIFRKDLDFAMSKLVEVLRDKEKTEGFDPFKFLRNFSSGYPIPVKRNVDFIRELSSVELNRSFIMQDYPHILDDFSDIIGGTYKSEKGKSLVYYVPNGNKREKLTLAESSSCVRSLLDLYYYVKHVARRGDILMIDEPEMNLHPGNQRKLARLLASLTRVGINVYITTHSDYIVKELSTLVVLKNNQPLVDLLKRHCSDAFKDYSLLEANDVRFYTMEKCRGRAKKNCVAIKNYHVGGDTGIDAAIFDETIDEMNRIHDLILWT